jgi:hypothetical protein
MTGRTMANSTAAAPQRKAFRATEQPPVAWFESLLGFDRQHANFCMAGLAGSLHQGSAATRRGWTARRIAAAF